jgi:Fe2+ or Zn2+ uptake regulation protein
MPSAQGYEQAIESIRKRGLPPTRENLLIAKMVLDRGSAPTVEDMLDEAYDLKLGLSRETLSQTLRRFREVGLIETGPGP